MVKLSIYLDRRVVVMNQVLFCIYRLLDLYGEHILWGRIVLMEPTSEVIFRDIRSIYFTLGLLTQYVTNVLIMLHGCGQTLTFIACICHKGHFLMHWHTRVVCVGGGGG